ncbi:MAG TPA: nucleotide exchange factor GrpE [Polyangiaceae bacterium]|nr:nucleotide exchange factor GrpE [Polyangiaceae bacterium]
MKVTEQSENPEPPSSKAGPSRTPPDANSDSGDTEAAASAQQGEQAQADSSPADSPAVDPMEEMRAELARTREQLLRTAADFDNYRKRSRRESLEAEQRGREAFMRDVLPVFDNLERAVAHAEVATDVQSLLNGIQMVMRQFGDTLLRLGIERVKTVGVQFDPTIHEAIQHLETDAYAPGVIAAEIQGGYSANKKLIRPAMVVVAKAKTVEEPPEAPAKHEAPPQSERIRKSEPSPSSASPSSASPSTGSVPESHEGATSDDAQVQPANSSEPETA